MAKANVFENGENLRNCFLNVPKKGKLFKFGKGREFHNKILFVKREENFHNLGNEFDL